MKYNRQTFRFVVCSRKRYFAGIFDKSESLPVVFLRICTRELYPFADARLRIRTDYMPGGSVAS
jgi:hypothetical protein